MAKIVAAQTTAAGVGGHDFWILFGDDGTMIDQIHGFAVDPNGSITTTAVTGKLIAVDEYRLMDYNSNSPQQTVIEAPMSELRSVWDAAEDCAAAITFMNYDYNALALDGYNSNSVYNTIGVCMGVDAPNIGAWYTVTPGLDDVILSQEVMQDIQEAYNIGGGRGNLQPNDENLPQIVTPGPLVAQLVGISNSGPDSEMIGLAV